MTPLPPVPLTEDEREERDSFIRLHIENADGYVAVPDLVGMCGGAELKSSRYGQPISRNEDEVLS
jgi:hypothetical protein